MLAVVKAPHIRNKLTLYGVTEKFADWLRCNGCSVAIKDNDDDVVNVKDTQQYKETVSTITPGDALATLRHRDGLSQSELAKKLGPTITNKNISDMEHNRRAISKEMAKNISTLFKVPIDRFM